LKNAIPAAPEGICDALFMYLLHSDFETAAEKVEGVLKGL